MLSKISKRTVQQASRISKTQKKSGAILNRIAYGSKIATTQKEIQPSTYELKGYARQAPQNISYGVSRSPFPVAAVFGCNGFIGRYIVCELARVGYQVIVPYRYYEDSIAPLKVMGDVGQIIPIYYKPDHYDSMLNICARADIVVNAAGARGRKLFDFKPTFSNFDLPVSIAKACADTNVSRFIHISHQGVSPVSSAVSMRDKYRAEQAIRDVLPHSTIVRPNVVMGPEDRFLNLYGAMLSLSPNVPLFERGRPFVQPVYAPNIGDAIVEILRQDRHSETFELSGPDTLSHMDTLRYIAEVTQRDYKTQFVPTLMARPLAYLNEFTWKPTVTRDYVEVFTNDLLKKDELPGFEDLGIVPAHMEDIAPDILSRFNENDDPNRPPKITSTYIKSEHGF